MPATFPLGIGKRLATAKEDPDPLPPYLAEFPESDVSETSPLELYRKEPRSARNEHHRRVGTRYLTIMKSLCREYPISPPNLWALLLGNLVRLAADRVSISEGCLDTLPRTVALDGSLRPARDAKSCGPSRQSHTRRDTNSVVTVTGSRGLAESSVFLSVELTHLIDRMSRLLLPKKNRDDDLLQRPPQRLGVSALRARVFGQAIMQATF